MGEAKLRMEKRLLDMCKQTLAMLYLLREQRKITEEEFQIHKKLKLKFIRDYSKGDIEYLKL